MYEYGWQDLLRWQERYPGLRIDTGQSKMRDLLKDARLAVYTYNSTGYLEAFASNIPTVIFWDPAACLLRGSAIPYFEDLKRAGVYH